jgi:hypothetical protein
MTQLQMCVKAVSDALKQAITTLSEGATVDAAPIASEYGTDSPENLTYLAILDNKLSSYYYAHGTDRAWQAVAGLVPEYCQQFGATGANPTPAYTPSTDPLSVGCPRSRQLLMAWKAAPASARDSWFRAMTPTGFFGTECWHQWIVTNPVIQANGPVVFTDTGGQLSLLPQTGLSELDAAICGIPGAPSDQWAGPGGPAMCP